MTCKYTKVVGVTLQDATALLSTRNKRSVTEKQQQQKANKKSPYLLTAIRDLSWKTNKQKTQTTTNQTKTQTIPLYPKKMTIRK